MRIDLWFCLALCALMAGCVAHPRYRTKPIEKPVSKPEVVEPAKTDSEAPEYIGSAKPYQVGLSSYYAHKFHGRPTASGEIFDMNALSAAHRELPLGTVIRVTHLGNGKSVTLKVNDRGPFVEGRILDLSLGAARTLDMVEDGVAKVMIEIVQSVN